MAAKRAGKKLPEWAVPEEGPPKEPIPVSEGELVGSIPVAQWEEFLELVSDGKTVVEALEKVGLSRWKLTAAIRSSEKARTQYESAKLAAVHRLWDMDTVEEVLQALMLCEEGGHLVRILENRGLDTGSFYQLLNRDPYVKEMYEEARQIQAEVMADKIREIADDGTNDTYVDEKGRIRVDQDVVARSRVRVETLKWVMSKLHYKRFGDKVQQDVDVNLKVDIAEKLRAGRERLQRLENSRKRAPKPGVLIEQK